MSRTHELKSIKFILINANIYNVYLHQLILLVGTFQIIYWLLFGRWFNGYKVHHFSLLIRSQLPSNVNWLVGWLVNKILIGPLEGNHFGKREPIKLRAQTICRVQIECDNPDMTSSEVVLWCQGHAFSDIWLLFDLKHSGMWMLKLALFGIPVEMCLCPWKHVRISLNFRMFLIFILNNIVLSS